MWCEWKQRSWCPRIACKTSCSFFKLRIPLSNWNGLYVSGIRCGSPSLCPFNLLEVGMLYRQGFPGPTWKGYSNMDFPDRLSVFGKCHLVYRQSPLLCWLKHALLITPSFFSSLLVLEVNPRKGPIWFWVDWNMNIFKAARDFWVHLEESFIFANGETRLKEE